MYILRYARRARGLSQRQLADLSGVPQPAIARIEARKVSPRLDTLDRLLRASGLRLELGPRAGEGVDRTTIRALRWLTPAERAALAVEEARNLEQVTVRRRRRR